MKELFIENLPSPIKIMFQYFENKGELYMVGGCLRDILLNRKPKDIDFCTNLTPEEMKKLISQESEIKYGGQAWRFSIIPTGEQYGTLTFRLKHVYFMDGIYESVDQEFFYEVTTYRADGTYSDGRRPDNVTFSVNIEKDLIRRDFTINAIAWSPKTGFVDISNGIQDLDNKIIKCVGNPEERFREDALRVIRCLKFALRYNFDIDQDTYESAIKIVKEGLLSNVSKERIGTELLEILSYDISRDVSLNVWDLYFDILNYLFPTRIKERFNSIVGCPLLKWVYLAYEDADMLLQYGVGHQLVSKVANVIDAIDICMDWKHSDFIEIVAKRMLNICQDEEEIQTLIEYIHRIDDNKYSKDLLYILCKTIHLGEPITIKDLNITGKDLIKNDVPEGPEIGKRLNILQRHVWMHPEDNEKEILLKIALNSNK